MLLSTILLYIYIYVCGEKKMLFLNSLSLEGISVLTSVTFHFFRVRYEEKKQFYLF